MFYDTSSINRDNAKDYHVELASFAGARWFYETIRNFFSHIPAEEPYRSLGYAAADTPVAADLVARGCYVSNAPDLSAADKQLVVETLRAVARAEGLT